ATSLCDERAYRYGALLAARRIVGRRGIGVEADAPVVVDHDVEAGGHRRPARGERTEVELHAEVGEHRRRHERHRAERDAVAAASGDAIAPYLHARGPAGDLE